MSYGYPPQGIVPLPHELTHILGGADEINAALNALAIALTTQGDIPYRAAALNTLARLAPGVAGQALLTGGAGADPSWGAPAPAAHVLDTTGPHTGTLLLTDLEVGARGEIITRTVADWAALGVGAAGQALLSGGAGADVSWGAPAPAAHESTHVSGGSDDIDSALDGRAITLTTQGDLVYASGANTLARLAAGTAGQILVTGGAGANPAWSFSHQLDSAPDADSSGNGLTDQLTVGENVIEADTLYLKNDGKYWKSDADDVDHMPVVAMAMEAINADATGECLRIGYYRDDDRWNWTPGNGEANLLFAHTTAGDMVQFANKPAGAGDQVQVLGHIVDANTVFFNPSYELVQVA